MFLFLTSSIIFVPSVFVSCQNKKQVVNNNQKYLYNELNDYYKLADGKKGQELYEILNEIQKKSFKVKTKYSNLKKFYDDSNAFKDLYYENDKSILDVYSENPNGKDEYFYQQYNANSKEHAENEGAGLNREHLIPQSWFDKKEPIRSDAQFVWPSDIYVNSVRENFPHDKVLKLEKKTKNGSKKGKNKFNKNVFEPVDEFKGDIARAYLYYAITWNKDKKFNVKKDQNLVLQNIFPYLKKHYLDLYIKWNNEDSVDEFDIKRNNEIAEKWHGVRNPFIDYPDLAKSLFGNPDELVPFKNKGVLIGLNK
ncbi:endonuclease [[Mycoplasma] collis]|uniref:endonuclease n=1 Tax=[Mycoplasma] collis TaxID=2127 RepID=UPI00146F984F|nr:endonuclease [[Mycoplasma] collis]